MSSLSFYVELERPTHITVIIMLQTEKMCFFSLNQFCNEISVHFYTFWNWIKQLIKQWIKQCRCCSLFGQSKKNENTMKLGFINVVLNLCLDCILVLSFVVDAHKFLSPVDTHARPQLTVSEINNFLMRAEFLHDTVSYLFWYIRIVRI